MGVRTLALILSALCLWTGFATPSALAQGRSVAAAGSGHASQEFIMACTYGVLAGSLIGAATLAFVDKPSDNLNKVARGASLGLYAGILLGAYVVYAVPDDEDDNPLISANPLPNFIVFPTLSEKGIDGAFAQMNLLSF